MGRKLRKSLSKTNNNLTEIYPLTPIDIDKGNSYYHAYKAYKARLVSTFENKELTNIAISGYFGIGKSSILKTFSKEESKKFLHISLIDFSNNADMSKKDNKIEKVNELEADLCRQLFSACEKKDFPKLRFQTVPEEIYPPKLWCLIIFISFYALVLLSSLFSNYLSAFFHKLGGDFGGYGSLILHITCIILTAVLVFLVVLYVFKHVKIKEFNLKSAKNNFEVSASWSVGIESVIEMYRFDLIYVLEKLSEIYDAIVFEDMDRLDTKDSIKIFSQLREINICSNNRILQKNKNTKKRNNVLRFIYVVNDGLTSSLNQTKFFDYIISVIPALSVSSAKEKFEKFVINELKIKLTTSEKENILSAVEASPDLSDYRTLNQIKNDYNLFLSIAKEAGTNMSDKEGSLLAFVIYKVLCPGDYHLIACQKSAIFPVPRSITADEWLSRGCSIQNGRAIRILTEGETALLTASCLKFIGYSRNDQKKLYKQSMLNDSRKRKLQILKDDDSFICGEIIIEETNKEKLTKMIYNIQNELLIYFVSNFSKTNNSFELLLESLTIDEGTEENRFITELKKELLIHREPKAFVLALCFFIKRGYKSFDWFFSEKTIIKTLIEELDKINNYDFSVVFKDRAPADLKDYISFFNEETKMKKALNNILLNKTK